MPVWKSAREREREIQRERERREREGEREREVKRICTRARSSCVHT